MSDEPRTGIPMLAAFTNSGVELPAEPILYFDRMEGSPRERLQYKLKTRLWRADVIEQFLDDLGFRP